MEQDFGIHASIGRGPLGRTYRATRADGTEVALKVLSADAAAELDLDHLRRTLRALRTVSHHAIPGDVEVGEYRGDVVISHGFVDGVDVGRLVSVAPMPPRVALEVAAEVAGALAAAARAPGPDGRALGIRHGDLRPACILLQRDGEVRVVGFGQSRVQRQYQDRTLTRFVESLGYMSPERLDGQDSASSDVYSLALCLFTMVSGEVPQRTSANPKRHGACQAQTLEILRHLLDPAHLGLADLIDDALAYDPARRPSMAVFARRCVALAAEIGGLRAVEWAPEWLPVLRAAHAELPFTDRGEPLSSMLPEHPLAMEPMTLSPSPAHRRSGPTRRPAVDGRWLLGLGLAVLVVGVLAFFAGRL